jgi:hypothetical protein
MKRYVFHLYSLLLDKEFLSDIKSFREKWYSFLKEKEYYQKLKNVDLAPPVNFNNPDLEYIHPNMIINDYFTAPPKFWDIAAKKYGLKKYSEYIEETGDYKGICGYQVYNKDDELIEFYINKTNTSKELYEEFTDLLNKYNFPFSLLEINKHLIFHKNESGGFDWENLVKEHPLYYFLSSLCVFKLEYFLGPESKEQNSNLEIKEDMIFNPKDFLLYTLNLLPYNLIYETNLYIQFQFVKTLELLNNDNYSKKDILDEINDKKLFELFKEEYEDELNNMPNLFVTSGVVQSKEHWKMMYYYLKVTNNIDIGKKSQLNKLRQSYVMYLNRNMTKEAYMKLGYDVGVVPATSYRRINQFNDF